MPEFIMDWFDFLVPIAVIMGIGWVLVYQLHFDIFGLIVSILSLLMLWGKACLGLLCSTLLELYCIPSSQPMGSDAHLVCHMDSGH